MFIRVSMLWYCFALGKCGRLKDGISIELICQWWLYILTTPSYRILCCSNILLLAVLSVELNIFFVDASYVITATFVPAKLMCGSTVVSRHSLPLYAEADEYIIGKVEAVSVTSITSLVGAPPSHILQLRSDTNTCHKLNQQVCSHNHNNVLCVGIRPQ